MGREGRRKLSLLEFDFVHPERYEQREIQRLIEEERGVKKLGWEEDGFERRSGRRRRGGKS